MLEYCISILIQLIAAIQNIPFIHTCVVEDRHLHLQQTSYLKL